MWCTSPGVVKTSWLRKRRGLLVITEDLFAAVVLVTDSLVPLTSSIHVGTCFHRAQSPRASYDFSSFYGLSTRSLCGLPWTKNK